MSEITLLAIETSCDETGVAVVRGGAGKVEVLAQQVASQMDIHAATGGVVPEVAAREHVTALQVMLPAVLREARVVGKDLSGIAVTVGPGLQPALAVGVNAARALAYAWQKPLVPVHHLEGHIYSALLRRAAVSSSKYQVSSKSLTPTYLLPATNYFPALALIVSGGHTQLILVRDHVTYEVVGTTRDDAAGEAFDKIARLLGLPYPGGPPLSQLARAGSATAFSFTRPMVDSGDFHFSFSGLKTAVLYAWRALSEADKDQRKADLAASFEQTVVDTLVTKTRQAAQAFSPRLLLLAGGVAANTKLREALSREASRLGMPLSIAPPALTGDNAAMIGQAGIFAYERGRQSTWRDIDASARLPITAWPRQ